MTEDNVTTSNIPFKVSRILFRNPRTQVKPESPMHTVKQRQETMKMVVYILPLNDAFRRLHAINPLIITEI